ncbi:DUF1449 domain-containing protein [Nostoc sp. CCY0012]|uniref:DUF1449 domain-containing protein n=1 Tax=Nostoc sp. CCY0012 TaxID=1056123 RepID=UPI0039C6646F
MLFSPANLPYWIFLGMGVLLFLFVIISGGGDGNTDADFDADTNGELNFEQFLGWAGIGKAPLILLLATDLSLWGILGWMLNVFLSSFIGNFTNFFGSIILFSSLIISLLLGRLIAQPMGKIFAEFGEDTSSDRLVGCVGTVTSFYVPIENQEKIGQVDVLDPKRNLLTISAVLPAWATVAPQRGEKVIIIECQPQKYLVIAKDSADEERWLANSTLKN